MKKISRKMKIKVLSTLVGGISAVIMFNIWISIVLNFSDFLYAIVTLLCVLAPIVVTLITETILEKKFPK